eukprot:jgi/Chlat1/4599/Chrsp290S00319
MLAACLTPPLLCRAPARLPPPCASSPPAPHSSRHLRSLLRDGLPAAALSRRPRRRCRVSAVKDRGFEQEQEEWEEQWEEDEEDKRDRGSGVLGMVLGKAVQLFVRSQLDSSRDLDVKIFKGKSSGRIGGVRVVGRSIVYKGIRISNVTLRTGPIDINLNSLAGGQVLKHPFTVTARILLSEADLLADDTHRTRASDVRLTRGAVGVDVAGEGGETRHVSVKMSLGNSGRELSFRNTSSSSGWFGNSSSNNDNDKSVTLDLGRGTKITHLTVDRHMLVCLGSFLVTP